MESHDGVGYNHPKISRRASYSCSGETSTRRDDVVAIGVDLTVDSGVDVESEPDQTLQSEDCFQRTWSQWVRLGTMVLALNWESRNCQYCM